MKTNKSKPQQKSTKKAVKKQLEQSLTERFLDAVKSLGHNAEVIGDDIAKVSKAVARKLSKKLKNAKLAVGNKIDKITDNQKPTQKVKIAKKDAAKLIKKVDKTVAKKVKKAIKKAQPATSVKVEPIATPEKAEKAISKRTTKPAIMENKGVDKNNETKKTVVKAVANNPVKKVANKAVPTKKNTTTTSTKK